MSEFICPVLISTDLAGRIFFLMAPCCDSEVLGGGGEGSPASGFPRQIQQKEGPPRCEGGSLSASEFSLYFARACEPAPKWDYLEELLAGNKDASLFSCGLYFEERKDA